MRIGRGSRAKKGPKDDTPELPLWALKRTLRDEDPRVRQQAVLALGRIGDDDAVTLLGRALDDPSPVIRTQAILALKGVGSPDAVALILHRLKEDPHPVVRARAADLLGDLGDPRHVRHLCAAIEDHDEAVSKSAAEAVKKLGGPDVLGGPDGKASS